jgi:hypothetical protein
LGYQRNNNGGDGRRYFGGNNYNQRRFNNAPFNERYGTNRNPSSSNSLNAIQQQLVKDTAEALARQFADKTGPDQGVAVGLVLPNAPQTSVQIPKANDAVSMAASAQRSQLLPQQSTGTNAEAALLAVAGITKQVTQTAAASVLDTGDNATGMKKKGPTCYRCGKTGHCLNECEVILCDCCQRSGHITTECPLLKAPRPRLAMYGFGHVDLSFWELPLSDSVKPRIENTRLGRVTVSGGTRTVPELITQLQWIVPEEQYQWEVQEVEANVYRVNFPSKIDLVRVQHFGRFHIPDSAISMSFDFWKKEIEPVWSPEDTWVWVHKLPPFALDDFFGYVGTW